MKNIYLAISIFIYSTNSFADRYGIYEDYEPYNGNSLIYFAKVIGAIFFTIIAYWYLYQSYIERKSRKSNGVKIVRESIAFDYIAPLIG